MRLTGIIEQSFRGQIIFRGFATLRHLANLSKPSFCQRPVDAENRLDEICTYLNESQFLFFPELIFSWPLDDVDVIAKICNNAKGSVTSSDGIKFTKALFKLPEENYLIGDNPTKKDLTIEIPDNIIEGKPLNRIDGNHRLSAIDKLMISDNSAGVLDKIVPYSILLQSNGKEAKEYEAAYFYIINSKATPLTSEQNFKAIFSQEFTDTQIMDLLSISETDLLAIKQIKSVLDTQNLYIASLYDESIYTFCVKLVRLGLGEYSAVDIISALFVINEQYRDCDYSLSNMNAFLSIVLFYLRNKNDYLNYFKWLKAGNIKGFEGATPEDLINMYNELCVEKSYKVFVAMPYVSFKRVNDFNHLFTEVCDELSKKYHQKITLIPIMRARGDSKRIDQRLIENIRNCDIFVADITGNNDNVIFEVGLAQGCNKPTFLIRANPDSEIRKNHDEDIKSVFEECDLNLANGVPFDMDKLQYIPYSITGYYNDLKGILMRNLSDILENVFGLVLIDKK